MCTLSPGGPVPTGFHFVDALHGWLVGATCEAGQPCRVGIFASADGGRTWSRQLDADILAGGFLVTSLGREGYALRATEDGGATWTQMAVLPPWQYGRRSVSFPSASVGWIADGKRLLATSDGGRSWKAYDLGALDPQALEFTDGKHGWMLDERGGLYRTTDGGASWEALP